MSSGLDDPVCFAIPTEGQNADMDGTAVAVANVIVNLCLRILVTWSPGDVDTGIQSLLAQLYPILLSTLLSTNRQQLSRFEAQFALLLSSSPLTIYLVVSSIGDLFGIPTGLYKRIKSYRSIICALGVLVPFIWIGLSMILMMWAGAFKDSQCNAGTFAYWFRYIIDMLMYSLMWPGNVYEGPPGVTWVMIIPWLACLARRWSQLRADVELRSEGASRFRVLCIWTKCAWCTIDRNHKWCIYYLFAYLDAGWAYQVILLALAASKSEYKVTYGQLLSLFFAVPTLVLAAEFVYSHLPDMLRFLRRLPRLCFDEARYLLTGKEPGLAVRDTHLPFNTTSYPKKPILGKPRDQMVTSVRSTHQSPLSPELEQDTRFCAIVQHK